jgi:sugar lactone lactonase YvrE
MQTWSARVGEDGSLENLELFVNQGGEGVTTDATGRVYLAAGDVFVYGADRTLIRTIQVPERPLQVVVGGPDGRTLYIPARHGLYAVHLQ